MENSAHLVFYALIRYEDAVSDQSCECFCKLIEVNLFDITVYHFRVVRDALEMLSVDVYEAGNRLVIENFADDVKVRTDCKCENFGFAVCQCETADLLLSQHDKVGQYGGSDALVVAVDDGVGIKLPAASGGNEFKFPSVLSSGEHKALSRISADAGDQHFCICECFSHVRIVGPDFHVRRRVQHRESCEVTLYAVSLYLFDSLFEIIRTVCGSEDGAAFGVILAATCPEMEGFFNRDGDSLKSGGRHLCHADQVVCALFVLPREEGVLRADREFSPPDEAVVMLGVGDGGVCATYAALVHDFMVTPAVSKERQKLGESVRPGALHVVHTTLDKLGALFVLFCISGGFDMEFTLPHEHFDGV